jgi:2'-hydroxyisoflavone reductase
MHILILGGGIFVGAAALDAARAAGHAVTVVNRGRSRTTWPPGVEVLTADRSVDLACLRGRRFDAVIDTCGYVPADVQASVEATRGCGAYLFVSSVSAYATTHQMPVTETDPLASFGHLDPADRDRHFYGPQKAACEAVLQRLIGARALIVRPGLVVGPGDPTGRFSHWPWRAVSGGEMLVPDMPANAALQFIDVRDLGDWMVRLLERGASGVFNASGPVGGPPLGWAELLAACNDAAAARHSAAIRTTAVGEAFLRRHGVQPWSELPLWLPSADPAYAGFMRIDTARAATAGLRTRPLRETLDAVLDEGLPPAGDPRRASTLTREREAALLAAWAADPAEITTVS